MYTELITDVKGRPLTPIRLARCNAVVGDNRGGKTSLLDAVRLAHTAQHAVGRFAADLMELAGHGSQSVTARMTGPEEEAVFILNNQRETKKITHDLSGRARGYVVSPSFRNLIDQTTNAAREAVLSRFETEVSEVLPEQYAALLPNVVAGTKLTNQVLTDLLPAIRSAKAVNSQQKTAFKKVIDFVRQNGLMAGAELVENVQAKAYSDVVRRLIDEIAKLDEQSASLKAFESFCWHEARRRFGELSTIVSERVSARMPSGFEALFIADDEQASWTVIGTDGRPHRGPMISGAERSALTLALMRAWPRDGERLIALFDDEDIGPFHSTPKNLQAFLAAIEDETRPAYDNRRPERLFEQVFVAGLRESEVPPGWNVIKV